MVSQGVAISQDQSMKKEITNTITKSNNYKASYSDVWGKLTISLGFFLICCISTRADPPFWGTIFIESDIIKPSDPSSFSSLSVAGQGYRTMYDRRENGWVRLNAYLFNAAYDDGLKIEVQVNPEFGSVDRAKKEAEKYSKVIGQLTTALRKDVETVWIHKGVNPFGGGNNNLLIHTGQAAEYIKNGILEETFVHEAAHTSLDARHANSAGWLAAQKADGGFISNYAHDYPQREDVAESFLPYFAVRYRPDRVTSALKNKIKKTIPHRIKYFDGIAFDMYPVIKRVAPLIHHLSDLDSQRAEIIWNSQVGAKYIIESSSDLSLWKVVGGVLIAEFELSSRGINLNPNTHTYEFFRVGLK